MNLLQAVAAKALVVFTSVCVAMPTEAREIRRYECSLEVSESGILQYVTKVSNGGQSEVLIRWGSAESEETEELCQESSNNLNQASLEGLDRLITYRSEGGQVWACVVEEEHESCDQEIFIFPQRGAYREQLEDFFGITTEWGREALMETPSRIHINLDILCRILFDN
jgi:hypothetical protein